MDDFEKDKQGQKAQDQIASYIALGVEQERRQIVGMLRGWAKKRPSGLLAYKQSVVRSIYSWAADHIEIEKESK